MKRFFLFLFVAFLSLNLYGQNVSPLEMTDGYFQAGIQQPVHLVHPPPYPPQWLNLGEHARIWYDLAVKQGHQSPCSGRSQSQCNMRISFVSLADPKYSIYVDDEFRIDNELSISYSFPINREDTPLGAGKFVWTIEKDEKILFSHEVLVEVR